MAFSFPIHLRSQNALMYFLEVPGVPKIIHETYAQYTCMQTYVYAYSFDSAMKQFEALILKDNGLHRNKCTIVTVSVPWM